MVSRPATLRWSWLLGALVFSGGCLVNPQTRLPQPMPRSTQAEQRSYQIHDPFASSELGPETGTRPRAMDVPRTEAHRAMEQRAAHGGTPSRSFTVPTLPLPAPRNPLRQVVPE